MVMKCVRGRPLPRTGCLGTHPGCVKGGSSFSCHVFICFVLFCFVLLRACVRACVCVYVHACVRVCACVFV